MVSILMYLKTSKKKPNKKNLFLFAVYVIASPDAPSRAPPPAVTGGGGLTSALHPSCCFLCQEWSFQGVDEISVGARGGFVSRS